MKLIIGITGSTGVLYGIRMLEVLKKLGVETHLIMSQWAEKCIAMETEYTSDYVKSLATNISDEKKLVAKLKNRPYISLEVQQELYECIRFSNHRYAGLRHFFNNANAQRRKYKTVNDLIADFNKNKCKHIPQ